MLFGKALANTRTENGARVARAQSAHHNVVGVLRVLNGDEVGVAGIETERAYRLVGVLEELRLEVGVRPRLGNNLWALSVST